MIVIARKAIVKNQSTCCSVYIFIHDIVTRRRTRVRISFLLRINSDWLVHITIDSFKIKFKFLLTGFSFLATIVCWVGPLFLHIRQGIFIENKITNCLAIALRRKGRSLLYRGVFLIWRNFQTDVVRVKKLRVCSGIYVPIGCGCVFYFMYSKVYYFAGV